MAEGGRTGGGGGAATIALGLGVAAVLASWVPVAGLVLGAAAVGLALWSRRAAGRARTVPHRLRVRSRRALGVGGFGLLLGLGFTVAWRACTPAQETAAERKVWEDFEKAFEAPAP